MMRQKTQARLPNCSPSKGTRLITILNLLCITALVMTGIWVGTAWTQSKKESGNQEPQGRLREIKSQTQGNVSAREPNSQNNRLSTKSEKADSSVPVPYYSSLDKLGVKLDGFCSKNDPVARRILEDYGAIFVVTDSVVPPPFCIFANESAVLKYQNDAKFISANIGGTRIDLQPAAMEALLAARQEANEQGLDITPRGGTKAARRSYNDTLRLWNSRFLPAIAYWNSRGRLSCEQVAHLRKLSVHNQVAEVLELEQSGIFFSKDFSKSILYSVAAPGTSQHISMLALDVTQFGNARVRRILAQHGWFQTVKSDLPHFTYLGLKETDLPSRGLQPVKIGSQIFWIPNGSGNNQQLKSSSKNSSEQDHD